MKFCRQVSRRHARGFLLLEVVVATGLFASVIVGLAVAMDQLIGAVEAEQRQLILMDRLESAAAEAKALTQLSESEVTFEPDVNGVVVTRVIEMYEAENQDGVDLERLFLIRLAAAFEPDTKLKETMTYELVVYRP